MTAPLNPTPRDTTKRALSPVRQQLVELLQRLNFGRIENLEVRDGEPVFNSSMRVVREYKFCAENGPRPEAGRDCKFKNQVADLMQLLDDIGDGTIAVLTVKHGLPFHAELPG